MRHFFLSALAVFVGVAAATERIPADVQRRFEASVADARALDSTANEQHLRALGMLQGAQKQLARELNLIPEDTLNPDGTISRHGKKGNNRQ